MLESLCFLHFGFLFYCTIPWDIETSKNEAYAALWMVIKLDLSLHARQGFRCFLVLNLQPRGSCAIVVNFPYCCIFTWRCKCKSWIIFQAGSVLLHFSKFRGLVFFFLVHYELNNSGHNILQFIVFQYKFN